MINNFYLLSLAHLRIGENNKISSWGVRMYKSVISYKDLTIYPDKSSKYYLLMGAYAIKGNSVGISGY